MKQKLVYWKENKIDKLLVKLTKEYPIIKIRDEKEVITIKIQRIIRKYFKNLYSNKMENLEEMDKFLHAYDLS
jgi:hypothetical protein